MSSTAMADVHIMSITVLAVPPAIFQVCIKLAKVTSRALDMQKLLSVCTASRLGAVGDLGLCSGGTFRWETVSR